MTEPEPLRRGKRFQAIVQADLGRSEDGSTRCEAIVELLRNGAIISKRGRADILITEKNEIVAVLEIKATDWDRIKPQNVKRNLWRHQHQLYSYVEKFLEIDSQSLSGYIIYPTRPNSAELGKLIEEYLEGYGVLAHWYDEIAAPVP